MADQTGLQFSLALSALSDTQGNEEAAPLAVVRFSGQEQLSSPFMLDIEFESPDDSLTPRALLDTGARLSIYQDGQLQRTVDGIIAAFECGIRGARRTRYALTLRPMLWRCSLIHSSRIFQQNDPKGIITTLLSDAGVTSVRFDVARQLEMREYCVQYRETGLAFIERLAAEEGLLYYHEFSAGTPGNSHTLVFTDDTANLPTAGRYTINTGSGGQTGTPSVWRFHAGHAMAPTAVVLKDYTFRKPEYDLRFEQTSSTAVGTFEHFDYPGRFKKDASGAPFTTARLTYLRRASHTAEGDSNIAALAAGSRLSLSGDSAAGDGIWAVTAIHHEGQQDQAVSEDAISHAASRGTRYDNTFELIPGDQAWAPRPVTKPHVNGPQIAFVVGEKGEEIDCDEYGRVRVLFPWDQETQASAWLRVAQGWAGPGYGMMAIPRIGHEVIVTFLEGDPDQPIITGRTFNAESLPPYTLPAHKTRSVLRTRTHQGEGYNELHFEDASGQENILLQAQRNLEAVTLNNRVEQVGQDASSRVKGHRYTSVGVDEHHTVAQDRREHIKGSNSLTVNGTLHIKAGKAWLSKSGREVHIKAGQRVVIDAGTELTIEAGGSFIKLDPSGVTMSGPTIKLNSGGSAASGAEPGAQAPAAPKTPQQK